MALIRLNSESSFYEFDPENHANLLGKGGMGAVFKGRRIDKISGRQDFVAIKVLFKDLPQDAILRARREASIQIDHENIIRMYGYLDVADTEGKPISHVISEYLDGETLDKKLQREGTLPEAQAIKIIKNVLSALYMLHGKGYIHRDIDPSNVMICTDGRVKLIDFGIAKSLLEYHDEFKQGTQEGKFIGKVNYASPEQAQGLHWITNTTSDIYSTGIFLFEMLMGRLPYSGTTYEVIKCHIESPIVFDQNMPQSLQHIIAKATKKEQKNRYQSVSEFIVDLERYEKGEKIPFPRDLKEKKKGGASTLIYSIIIAFAFVGIAVGGGLFLLYQQSNAKIQAAQLAFELGNYDEALKAYEGANAFLFGASLAENISRTKQCAEIVENYNSMRYEQALELISSSNMERFPDAYFYLGNLEMLGLGTAKNQNSALVNLTRGASEGSILANYRLGEIYQNGEGVKADSAQAKEFFNSTKKAIDELDKQDDFGAQLKVVYAKMLYKGELVPEDTHKALQLLQEAAKEGLAAAYFEAYKLIEDKKEAYKMLEKAVDMGYTLALYEMAINYEKAIDYSNAHKLLELAAKDNYSPAYYKLSKYYSSATARKYKSQANDVLALKYLKLALEYDPNNSEITQDIKKVESSIKNAAQAKKRDAEHKARIEAQRKAKAEAEAKARAEAKAKAEEDKEKEARKIDYNIENKPSNNTSSGTLNLDADQDSSAPAAIGKGSGTLQLK